MSSYEFTTSFGEKIPIVITVRRGLRNITLRPCVRGQRCINISRPWLSSDSAALKFVEQKRKWIDKIFANAPQKTKLKSGDVFNFLGNPIRVIYDKSIRANRFVVTDMGQDILYVGGDENILEHRVRMFIKSELMKYIKEIIHTTPKDFWPKKICLRDTSSRWGSCSTTGTISFSWRLGFAPPEIARYVIMHELAHTQHMDHSPEFWATVRKLYGFGVERARRWLSKNGGELHKYL